MSRQLRSSVVAALILIVPSALLAQSFDVAGTRAQGMAGAFVAVADDASAVYWNPGALAAGAYLSLIFDRTSADATLDDGTGGSRSSWLLALGAPQLGISYYRLRQTTAVPLPVDDESLPRMARVESLVTHHAGATLVQSLTDWLAVGATVKLVHGIATAGEAPVVDTEDLLDSAEGLSGRSTDRADVDAGIMAVGSFIRAGLVVRNIAAPGFDTSGGEELRLERQARAGVALSITGTWLLAADFDLTRNDGPLGDDRAFALGAEGRVVKRAFARAGLRLNTAGGDRGHQPAVTFGGTYAVTGSVLVDGQVTTGSDDTPRGWGIAGRIIF